MQSRKATVVPLEYQGQAVRFNTLGWINATEAARRFGKRPHDWLRLPDTIKYIQALERTCGKIPYVKTSRTRQDRGGGTWIHPDLAVLFARWLSVDFAVWCDQQIKRLIYGNQDDWQELRDSAAIGYRGMCDALNMSRQAQGKESKRHHFMNEAKLINGVLFGQFTGVDRDALTPSELRLVAMVEQRDTFLMGQGLSYQERKEKLTEYVEQSLRPRLEEGAA
ncbi:KilA-N domain-containing protein [Halomonas sp. I1]|uniref:KilA-N domain-containing protein n=1 Tax=Halomonas sp. I1 TaxID=393536 RepID=UPI0028DDEB21|nr:KilA-N domain-containing protein [Halomonas sp. I1]MDT8895800.1 KilA-N domain-containing protein [Halomonas sp. I1]